MMAEPKGKARGLGTRAGAFQLARALAHAATPDQVATAVFDHAMVHLGASTCGIWLVGGDGLIRFAGGAGHPRDRGPDSIGPIAPESPLPAALAVRTGELISYGSVTERDARWPVLTRFTGNSEAVAVVPLRARDRTIGCLHIGWGQSYERFAPDTEMLWALSELCATTLDRALLFAAERSAREALEFLSEGTKLMVSALEPTVIVEDLVRLAVPRLAPWCAVYVAAGDRLVRVAIDHSLAPDLAAELRAAAAVPLGADMPLVRVYRSGEALYLDHVGADAVLGSDDPAHARNLLRLAGDRWAAFVVPVKAAGDVIGVVSLLAPDWHDGLPAEVRYAAEGLAARAGVALHNARRYREQVDNVRLLTAALLPERLPTPSALRLAARYVPASGGVCGDWYEAELLPSGRLLIGVGDASGHGLAAAATMARIRHAARGLAVTDTRPGRLLDLLSTVLTTSGDTSIATAVYASLDATTGDGFWACAGHPPPIAIGADHTVACLGVPTGPVLGVDGEHPELVHQLGRGMRIVLYTDGVFERRGENPQLGIERLVAHVRTIADATEDEMADAVIARRGDDDDACVLVVGH